MYIFCARCGTEAAINAKFCASCGHSLKFDAAREVVGRPGRATSHANNRKPQTEQRGSRAGVDAYNKLVAEKSLRRMKALGTGCIGVVLTLATYQLHGRVNGLMFWGLVWCTLGAFIATIWFYTPERPSQDQYQALPGAVTDRGHQCVFCGWRGIHRHTHYKTDTTLADCSKCNAELWYE